MVDAVERIMNLALAFTDARTPLTAEQVRSQVEGYDSKQEYPAFARMFERDKEDLRRSGFVIEFDEEHQVYQLDRAATFAAPITLTAEESAVLRVAGAALLDDASFPFAADLRLALAKIAADAGVDGEPAWAPTRLADEDPVTQGATTAALADAAERRKSVTFSYTNADGGSRSHAVEPFGLFLHDGRWYLVGRDVALDDVRTYAITRVGDLVVNAAGPKTADFERPADFDVSGFIRLPFQYGAKTAESEATIRFAAESAWRAAALTRSQGVLESDGDELVWRVTSRSSRLLLRWVLEHGPGITIDGPPDLVDELRSGLATTEALHG